MRHKALRLYRIEIPWFRPAGDLLLAIPHAKQPPARDKDQANARNLEISEALTELQKSGEFAEGSSWSTHGSRQLSPLGSGEGVSKEPFKWRGWQYLVLPTGCTFGLKGEWPFPIGPNRNPLKWPHDIIRGLVDILETLENGGSILQFHPSGLATAGYLAALLSAIAEPHVYPSKIVYPVLSSGLGLNSFHYGILIGMDSGRRR